MFGRTRVPNITPFTYRDNLTYLEWLRWLSHAVSTNVDKLNDVINGLNDLRDDTAADLQRIHLDLFRRLSEEFDGIREELFDLAQNGQALNPTNGRVENISKVVNDVYDNVRVHAMFDGELDYTLKTELSNNWTARYHDLETRGHWCDNDCSCRGHDGTTPDPDPEPKPTPVIAPFTMPEMTVGKTISPVQLSVSSGSPTVTTWTVSGLPAGVAASASGIISGTPTTAGVGTVEVAGTSAAGMIGTASTPWKVAEPNIYTGMMFSPPVTEIDGKTTTRMVTDMASVSITPGQARVVSVSPNGQTSTAYELITPLTTDRVGATFTINSITGAGKVRVGILTLGGTSRWAYPGNIPTTGDARFHLIDWCGEIEGGKSYTIASPPGHGAHIWSIYLMAEGATGNVSVSIAPGSRHFYTI